VASSILVADGNRERSARVLEACLAGGLQARRVETGPAALEAALADLPQLVIAAVELPLIDALRLSEILRANPRTAEARFLFLGRPTTRPPSPFDETLPGQTPAEEIATQAVAMLARQTRMDTVRRESAARRELEGQLAQIPLVDLIELLHLNRRSGVIELSRTPAGGDRQAGAIWVQDGELVHATVGSEVIGQKALFRLLGWREGRFTFSAERRAPTQTLSGPTRVLLLEGLRQSDELSSDSSLPPREAEVRLAVAKSEIPHAVHPVTQEVLLLLEMYERVGEIVEHCSHPDYQVLRTLQTLLERGLVTIARGESAKEAEKAGWLDPTTVRRLQDWLQHGRLPGQAAASAKLLLAASELEATRDFLRLLAPLPGFEVSAEAESGAFGEGDLVRLARLRLGDGPWVDIFHVPVGETFAPAWRTLAYGALGVLLVHTHPVAKAEVRLRPLVQCLSQEPGTRLFRVLLLRKGERMPADEVQARLALLDRSSLFLLPLEAGKDRFSLLATMLARVLP
jgi:CheY-like chemotaxis protein